MKNDDIFIFEYIYNFAHYDVSELLKSALCNWIEYSEIKTN